MKRLREYFYSLKPRERVMALAAILLMNVVFLKFTVVGPYFSAANQDRAQLAQRRALLKKSRAICAERKTLLKAKKAAASLAATIDSKVIAATTEALGAAELQKKLKELAVASHLTITRSASFPPLPLSADIGLRLLPVDFDINAETLGAFSAFLYEVEYGRNFFFFVDDLEVITLARGGGIRANIKGHSLMRLIKNK